MAVEMDCATGVMWLEEVDIQKGQREIWRGVQYVKRSITSQYCISILY